MSESKHLSGENRMFSAVHSYKRMARVTGFLANQISGQFTPDRPKTGRTKIERRNRRQSLGAIPHLVSKQNYSCAAGLSCDIGVKT